MSGEFLDIDAEAAAKILKRDDDREGGPVLAESLREALRRVAEKYPSAGIVQAYAIGTRVIFLRTVRVYDADDTGLYSALKFGNWNA